MARYINPFTDFGFKLIFGRQQQSEFLIDFLNELLRDERGYEPIASIHFMDKEQKRDAADSRGVIYDILCETQTGKRFIVEMQNASQAFFVSRSIYYASKAIVDQGETGRDWKYRYNPVYFVAFLNFRDPNIGDSVKTIASICDEKTGRTISDRMRYIYIQLPLFDKPASECNTVFDQWIYLFKNMEHMDTMPLFAMKRNLFRRLENVVSYSALDAQGKRDYDADLKAYRDINATLAYALDEGLAKGLAEGRAEGADAERAHSMRLMAQMGLSHTDIAKAYGISPQEVDRIVNA